MPTALLKRTIVCTVMATAFISGCSSDDDDDTGMEVIDDGSEMAGVDDNSGMPVIDDGTDTGGADGGTDTGGVDGGTDTGAVDGGTDTGGVDGGTDTGGVDGGTDTGGIDGGTDAGGVDGGTDTGGVDGGTDAGGDDGSIAVAGLESIISARPVDEAIQALRTALDNNDAIIALPVIDHQANALASNQTLRPTSVQLFGNPALGTPLMQVNQVAGLDLPQKILAWENEEGVTQLAYNSADYLQQRHLITGSESADTALEMISGALSNLSFAASGNLEVEEEVDTGSDTEQAPDVTASAGEGIIFVTSEQDMDTTYNALVAAIDNAEPLNLIAEVDHAANAENIGETLRPTRLVIFGNPVLGTPLMQAEQTIGIDLPQKMLVYENADGGVIIAYNDPVFLAARHGITGAEGTLSIIGGALAGLANGAASSSTQ